MASRHAVPAAPLDGEYSGHRPAKAFGVGVTTLWGALPQQPYVKLTEPEKEGPVVEQPEVRASAAEAEIELLGRPLRPPRGDADEEESVHLGERIGPYLTCLRGLASEPGHRCLRIATVLRERRTAHAER
ncbi:hypothetical protein [Streptomyces sp. NPDC058295]|uniref:hypothetical protein n=1 Tax=Streptomyces sp. NPDC058295 TaxID=3346431 RepID=UPI0036E3DF05